MKKKVLIIILVLLLILTGCLIFILLPKNNGNPDTKTTTKKISFIDDKTNDFNIRLLKYANSVNEGKNYLISPYSIEMALAMLKEGTNGESLKQIEEVIGSRSINDIQNKNVKVSNGIFIKDSYKKLIEAKFNKRLKANFNSEVLYDSFKSPKVINDWVNKKTDGMIKKLTDEVSDDFVLALVNAIAIDVKWQSKFECDKTYPEEFTKSNDEKVKVEMMHETYKTEDYKYIDEKDVKGIILPYEEESNLEFIALKNDNIYNYINDLTSKKLNKTIDSAKNANSKNQVNLSLPRFTYDYDFDEFKTTLISMGIKDVFDKEASDLTKIMSRKTMDKNGISNLYVSKAIHKTHIELSETGTKAAAVTGFIVDKATSVAPDEKINYIDIKFDKTFMYIIRDKNSKEVLFMGVVDSPNEWKGSTCSNK